MVHISSARRLAPLVLAPLLTLAVAGSAQGAVSVDGGNLILVGQGGFSINGDGAGHYRFFATGIVNSGGCTQGVNVVTCPADGVTSILAAGGSGDDTISVDASVAPAILAYGHDGNDTVTTGAGPDNISGGIGNDTLNGNTGDDNVTDDKTFGGGGGGGNDTLRGGAGFDVVDAGVLGSGLAGATSGGGHDLLDGGLDVDTVDYGKRTAPVIITVDSPGVVGNTGNDGEAGEQDNVINAEHIVGGSAGDTITASNIASTLDGGAGNDTLNGGDAFDTINPGFGSDTVDGGAGGDTILAQDGEVDTVTCGGDGDVVQADGFDNIAADCENVTRTAAVTPPGQTLTQTVTVEVPTPVPPQAGPVLTLPKTLKADRKGRVKISVGCPKATKAGCLFGSLTLSTAPKKGKAKKIASGTFSLKPGKTAKVTLTLNAATRKSLKKRRKLAVVLTANAINGDASGGTATAKLTVKR